MIDDERKAWLRGAYQDRLIEAAQHFARGRTHLVDAEWLEHGDDFQYLIELSAEDHAYLRDQAGLEAWRRIRDNNIAGRKAAFEDIHAEHPDVFSGDIELFAFDSGWGGLVRHVAERLETYPAVWKARITGGKEKFGCLVLWCNYDISQRGARSEIKRLSEEIRLRSLATCEICGSSGRLRLAGFAKTVCDEHVSILGELREDDGMHADPWHWTLDGAQPIDPDQPMLPTDYYDPSSAELLRDMDPVRPRPTGHVVDLSQNAIGRQIEPDIDKNYGRKADLLLEFCGALEIAVVSAMSVADEDVDFWLRSEVDRWQGVQPLSDDDREFLRQYLRSLAIDERGRRQRRDDGAKSLQRFFDDNSSLGWEAEQLVGRERELVDIYAGDLADSARGSVVKEEFLDGYIRDEIALWPHLLELSEGDKEWLRAWLRKMIDTEYGRIKGKD